MLGSSKKREDRGRLFVMNNRETELSSQAIIAQSPPRLPADGQEQFASLREAEIPKKNQETLYFPMAARPSSPVTECDCKSNNGADTSDSPVPCGTPPYTKWAEGLSNLLEDHDGVKLFGQYLKEEVQDTSSLDFLLACQGIRNQGDPNLRVNMIKVIYRNYVRASSSKLGIRPETKEAIDKRISNKIEPDATVFDAACKDVEFRMMKTAYPNFLRSDIYIQCVQMAQEECRTPDRVSYPASTDSECSASCLSDSVHMRLSDPSMQDLCGKKSQCISDSRERIDMLPIVFEDSETENSVCNRFASADPVVLPTRRLMSHLGKTKSENKAGIYLKASTSGYNSACNYAPYLPPSAQDSASSDVQTDDTMSNADSTENFSTSRKSSDKAGIMRLQRFHQQRGGKHGVINVEPLSLTKIPRTQTYRPPEAPITPAQFAELLTQKLEKLQNQLHMREILKNIIEGRNSTSDCAASNQGNSLALMASLLEHEDESQQILDEHVSRFIPSSHQTPGQSPGCLTPPTAKRQEDSTSLPSSLSSNVPRLRAPCSPLSNQRNKLQGCQIAGDFKSGRCSPHLTQQGRQGRDRDTYSIDSGLRDDMPSDIESQSTLSRKSWDRDSVQSRVSYPHAKQQNLSMMGRSDSGISLSVASGPTQRDRRMAGGCGEPWSNIASCNSSQWPSALENVGGYSNKSQFFRPAASRVQQMQFGEDSSVSYSSDQQCSNDNQMIEFSRRMKLEDDISYRQESKQRMLMCRDKMAYECARNRTMSRTSDLSEDLSMPRRSNRRSVPNTVNCVVAKPPTSDFTQVAYCIGHGTTPYLSKIQGKNITLRQFKSLVSKRGNFRYFFKTQKEDFGVVYEEINDDMEVLPLFDNKIQSLMEPVE